MCFGERRWEWQSWPHLGGPTQHGYVQHRSVVCQDSNCLQISSHSSCPRATGAAGPILAARHSPLTASAKFKACNSESTAKPKPHSQVVVDHAVALVKHHILQDGAVADGLVNLRLLGGLQSPVKTQSTHHQNMAATQSMKSTQCAQGTAPPPPSCCFEAAPQALKQHPSKHGAGRGPNRPPTSSQNQPETHQKKNPESRNQAIQPAPLTCRLMHLA